MLYADLTGDNIDEAIVAIDCDFYGNFFITEIFPYTLHNGEPVLFAKLPQSIIDRDYKRYYPEGFDFGISRVLANNGKLVIYKFADGSHACPENEVRFEYIWNGKNFALAGRPVKYPLRNCGAEEKPPSPSVASPVPTPTPRARETVAAQLQAQEPRYQGRTLAEWQGDLQDLSPQVRLRAIGALGSFGHEPCQS